MQRGRSRVRDRVVRARTVARAVLRAVPRACSARRHCSSSATTSNARDHGACRRTARSSDSAAAGTSIRWSIRASCRRWREAPGSTHESTIDLSPYLELHRPRDRAISALLVALARVDPGALRALRAASRRQRASAVPRRADGSDTTSLCSAGPHSARHVSTPPATSLVAEGAKADNPQFLTSIKVVYAASAVSLAGSVPYQRQLTTRETAEIAGKTSSTTELRRQTEVTDSRLLSQCVFVCAVSFVVLICV